MASENLTVTQFNQMIGSLISYTDSIRNISIVGEITEMKQATSGHIYLTLKDADSVLKCTLFRSAASRVKFPLKNGLKVTAFGSASYYVKGGSFSFNIESMALFGKGELQIALEELTAKLVAEGLFDPERKREIPRYPKRIGVVTSPTGAVIKDIIDTTARRYPVDILLSPATVQGTDAPKSIVHAIELLNSQDIDVMIVGRGGGSTEDLIAFNDESVVRAIASCRVPVISAVGHATDKSLTDRVADKYAETPTAAAMIATPDRVDENRNILQLWSRLNGALEGIVGAMRLRFDALDHRLAPRNAKNAVDVYVGRLDNASKRLDSGMEKRIMVLRSRFAMADNRLDPRRLHDAITQKMMFADELSARADRAVNDMISSRTNQFERLSAKLAGLNPENVLARGYSFIKDSNGNVITSAEQLFVGTDITIRMKDGTAVAKIKELKI